MSFKLFGPVQCVEEREFVLRVYRKKNFEIFCCTIFILDQNQVGTAIYIFWKPYKKWYIIPTYMILKQNISKDRCPLGIGQRKNSIFGVEIYIHNTFHNRIVFRQP